MMTRIHFLIATLLLQALLLPLSLYAQTESETLEEITQYVDSTELDSLSTDSLALPWPQSAQVRINQLLQSDMFKTSQVGIMVYDLEADSTIYKFNERQTMRPASTMKLITAITAIDRLGGDYQFKTELCYTGTIADGTLTGDLYCVGGFDPRFNNDDMKAFVEAIRKMGVDTIRGRLCADKSMKDDNELGEGWCWDDDNPTLSPLLVGRRDVFTSRFHDALTEAGVVVDADLTTDERPADANCICRRFHTIDQILMKMMKESDNLYAEAMFYQIAASTGNRPATAKSARSVIQQLIRKMGLDPSRYEIADGSGLSLYNYVTAELEVAMLRYAWKNGNIYLHLKPSLPEAGYDGTLRKRMTGPFTRCNVWAKTGTVEGVVTLAGYCQADNGHLLAFSILNQGVLHGKNGRRFQDQVCRVLCQP